MLFIPSLHKLPHRGLVQPQSPIFFPVPGHLSPQRSHVSLTVVVPHWGVPVARSECRLHDILSRARAEPRSSAPVTSNSWRGTMPRSAASVPRGSRDDSHTPTRSTAGLGSRSASRCRHWVGPSCMHYWRNGIRIPSSFCPFRPYLIPAQLSIGETGPRVGTASWPPQYPTRPPPSIFARRSRASSRPICRSLRLRSPPTTPPNSRVPLRRRCTRDFCSNDSCPESASRRRRPRRCNWRNSAASGSSTGPRHDTQGPSPSCATGVTSWLPPCVGWAGCAAMRRRSVRRSTFIANYLPMTRVSLSKSPGLGPNSQGVQSGAEAEAACRSALELEPSIRKSHGKQFSTSLAPVHLELARLLVNAKRSAEAEAAFRTAVERFREVDTPSMRVANGSTWHGPGLADAVLELSRLLADTNRAAEAEAGAARVHRRDAIRRRGAARFARFVAGIGAVANRAGRLARQGRPARPGRRPGGPRGVAARRICRCRPPGRPGFAVAPQPVITCESQ